MKQSMNTKIAKLEGRNEVVFEKDLDSLVFDKEVNNILTRYNKRNERTFEEAKDLTMKDLRELFNKYVEGFKDEYLVPVILEFADGDKGLHFIITPEGWEENYTPNLPCVVPVQDSKRGAIVTEDSLQEAMFQIREQEILHEGVQRAKDENGKVDKEKLRQIAHKALTIYYNTELDGFENFVVDLVEINGKFAIDILKKETPCTSYFKLPEELAERVSKLRKE